MLSRKYKNAKFQFFSSHFHFHSQNQVIKFTVYFPTSIDYRRNIFFARHVKSVENRCTAVLAMLCYVRSRPMYSNNLYVCFLGERYYVMAYVHSAWAWAIRLSSVCRLFVTLLHTRQKLELFGNIFAPPNSSRTRTVCTKIFGKNSKGTRAS